MLKMRRFFATLLFGMVAISTVALAQDKTPSGTVTINETQYALILGGTAGEGVLTFKNKTYPFKISGASLGLNVGVSKSEGKGEVYDLTDIAMFAGLYNKYESSITLGGGVGGTVLKNQNGVVMHLTSTSGGLQLNLSASGVTVELVK